MRGIVAAGERLGSHLACSSGRRRHLASESGRNGVLLLPARDSTRLLFPFIIKSEVFIEPKLENVCGLSKILKLRNAQKRFAISNPAFTRKLSTMTILEPGTYIHEPERSAEELNALKETFYRIIQHGQPDQVMNAFLDPNFEDVVASLPQSTFAEAFHLLSPAYFIEPYREIHRPLHPYAAKLKGLKPLESIFSDFADKLAAIVGIRWRSGNSLDLAEYTHLLDCARSIGSAQMAETIWLRMQHDKVAPDIHCYNYYMEAHIWHGAYTGLEKYRLRVTPYAYRKRRFLDSPEGWKGYGTAAKSVRKRVLEIFDEMAEGGIAGDEATFVNVFLAACRVGHVSGMKNVLKTIWNIHVDLIMKDDHDDDDDKHQHQHHPPVTEYDRSSPLYPTDRLLFAIAHGFGTNSDIYAALRVIDFISHSYDIPIPDRVWFELMERAYQLCRPRFGPRAAQDSRGKVPYSLVIRMFRTMTSDPYNVRPTLAIYRMLAKIAWDMSRLSEFEQYAREAYDLLKETRRKQMAARQTIKKYLDHIETSTQSDNINNTNYNYNDDKDKLLLINSPTLATKIHIYDLLRSLTAQQTILMQRLAKLLLTHRRWTGRDNYQVWERQHLPRIVEEWQDFLPESFFYHTRHGIVEFKAFKGKGSREVWGRGGGRVSERVPVRRVVVEQHHSVGIGGGCDSHQEVAMEVEEERYVDDDFFWEQYIMGFSGRGLDFGRPPLERLDWGVAGDEDGNGKDGYEDGDGYQVEEG